MRRKKNEKIYGEDLLNIGIMFLALILLGLIGSILVMSSDVSLPQIFGHNRVDYNETGYVEDIEFVGGGFGNPSQTLIRFSNGDVVLLQGRKMRIPEKQNITLYYHDNGFGIYFLDNFTKIGGEEK